MKQKLVRFCWTLEFSFTNFVGGGLDSDVNLLDSESRKTQSAHLCFIPVVGLSSFLRFNLIASSYPTESYFKTNQSIANDKSSFDQSFLRWNLRCWRQKNFVDRI